MRLFSQRGAGFQRPWAPVYNSRGPGFLMKSKRAHPERDLQISVTNLLLLLEHRGSLTFFHPPNGGSRNIREAVHLKRMGTRAGVSDIVLLWKDNVGFIELKAGRGKLSKAQVAFHKRVSQFGAKTATCKTFDEVLAILDQWEVPGVTSEV